MYRKYLFIVISLQKNIHLLTQSLKGSGSVSKCHGSGILDSEAIYSFFCPVQKSKVAQPLNSFDSSGKTLVIHIFDQRV
jgi:hypothetical protein